MVIITNAVALQLHATWLAAANSDTTRYRATNQMKSAYWPVA
jgi:hypothetical protein